MSGTGESHPPKTGDARILWDLDFDQFDALLAGDRRLLRPGDHERANYNCPICNGALLSTDARKMFECIRCGETVEGQGGDES